MIQEKDFLYRVPVKNSTITTPGGQIRNPEILVDLEGGEFMHGNILDANSTNKLINQSVKDAVDNKLIESGLQAAIATKADATALSNYVLTTALNQQIDTLNTAISAKQDKPDDGNMFFQVEHDSVSGWFKQKGELKFTHDDNDSFYASISPSGIYCMDGRDSDDAHLCSFTPTGIRFSDKTDKDIPTADGTFINVNDLASADDVSSLRAGLSRKQNKITVNEVDITDIETADITKLRTIVTNLINALSASDLIRETKTFE